MDTSHFLDAIESIVASRRAAVGSPVLVALDGRSGSGKSTLAEQARRRLGDCVVLDGDDFYSGGTTAEWEARSARQKVALGIDWQRQARVLDQLRKGEPGTWHGYDWEAFDHRRRVEVTTVEPASVVILDGAYSARPELAERLDLRILLRCCTSVRHDRLLDRDGADHRDDWLTRWTEAEDFYFGDVVPPSTFDLVLGPAPTDVQRQGPN